MSFFAKSVSEKQRRASSVPWRCFLTIPSVGVVSDTPCCAWDARTTRQGRGAAIATAIIAIVVLRILGFAASSASVRSPAAVIGIYAALSVGDVNAAAEAVDRIRACDEKLAAELLVMIRGYDLDVALSFGFRILRGEALRIAKHGVWSYHHGDNLVNRGGPAGFWEVMDASPISGSVLQVLSEDLDNGEVLDRTWLRTSDRFSVRISKNNLYWRSSSFVMRKLRELYERGSATREKNSFRPYYNRLHKMPTNAELLPRLARLTCAYARNKLRYAFYFDQWTLAYRFRTSPTDPNNSFYRFTHLTPPKDKFWADPFPVKHEGKYFVFFEEYLYKDDRAHISVMELTKAGPNEPVPVLKRDYHLSYPFMLEWQGRHYMIPETAGNKTVELYSCESFPDKWKLETVLLEGVPGRDATLFAVDGLWWMFVAIADTDSSDELYLYYSSTPLGPWTPHQQNPVKSDVRNSRPAGRPFYWNGELCRPAQDSSQRYGYAMTINRIVRLTPEEFVEQEISKILPQWRPDLRGTHTLNICEDLTIIDCLVHRRR